MIAVIESTPRALSLLDLRFVAGAVRSTRPLGRRFLLVDFERGGFNRFRFAAAAVAAGVYVAPADDMGGGEYQERLAGLA